MSQDVLLRCCLNATLYYSWGIASYLFILNGLCLVSILYCFGIHFLFKLSLESFQLCLHKLFLGSYVNQ